MPGQTLKDIRLEVKVRNNLILSAMESKGITSISELVECLGGKVSAGRLYSLVSMKLPARKKNGDWIKDAHELAEFFQCMPEDLFSEPQQYEALEKNRTHAELTYTELQQLTARHGSPVTPEIQMQASQLRSAVHKALQKLTPREERVLRLRFGFETGEDATLLAIADQFGVGTERVRQIEAKALRKLKHPARSGILFAAAGFLRRDHGDWKERALDQDVLDAL